MKLLQQMVLSRQRLHYVILGVAVFTLSPLLYEVLHRIPFIRWAVFGEKKS